MVQSVTDVPVHSLPLAAFAVAVAFGRGSERIADVFDSWGGMNYAAGVGQRDVERTVRSSEWSDHFIGPDGQTRIGPWLLFQ